MNYLKKLGISLLYFFGIILVLTFIATILNYFNLIGNSFISILEILIPIISIVVSGYQFGKKSTSKGWIEGLKLGSIIIVILLIMNLIFKNNIQFKNFIYFFILIFSSIIGSIIGINKNSKNKSL